MFLPPGFRFHPTDVELVMYYLKRKVLGKKHRFDAIAEVNIYRFSPWDLPDQSRLKSKDLEWFFFCPREKKYASGVRVKRGTEKGFWKTTGKDRPISYGDRIVGSVKTLVFHLGHAPKGKRTDWVIHEYGIRDGELAAAGVENAYVLCKVFKKSGPGPKNGAQYGVFKEEDWLDDDIDVAQNHDISLTSNDPLDPLVVMPEEQSRPPVTGLFDPGSTSRLPLVEEGACTTSEVVVDDAGDDLDRLLAAIIDYPTLQENEIIQEDPSGNKEHKSTPDDGCEIFDGLTDLEGWMNDGRLDFSGMQIDDCSLNNMPFEDNAYIELDDLWTPLCCSDGVTGSGQILGHGITENMGQFYPEGNFTGIDQNAPCATQLPQPPEGCSKGDNCLEAFEMGDDELYRESTTAYDQDFACGQPGDVVNFTEHMERGTPKKICMSRSIPARPPSAAAHSFCRCGGSSIHIKAEVTHGAGECTNEALSLMMGGSGSCWCILPRAVFQELCYLIYLVESDSIELLLYCCLNVRQSDLWNYCCVNEHSSAMFFPSNFKWQFV